MRIYLIGAGVISRTHAEAAAKLPEPAELRAADPNPNAIAAFLEKFPGVLTFGSAQDMLDSEPPREDDVVIVGTPPFAHVQLAVAALKSGRHVLCEKPLAMNMEEAELMLATANAHSRLLGCCSVRFKGMHHMEATKRIVRSGELGDIYHMTFVNKWERSRSGIEYQPESPWFLDSSKSGGGVLMDWGPYDMSALLDVLDPVAVDIESAWLAKPVTSADPADLPFDVETHVGASMTFHRNGLPSVHVHYERASCAHGKEYVRAEIEGTRGSVSWTPFDSRQPVYIRQDQEGKLAEHMAEMPPRLPTTIFDHPLLHFYQSVKGLPSFSNVNRRAFDHFLLIRALYDCAQTGMKPQTITIHRDQEVRS
ncbi:Gfo/Idh/MocA family oxidoreductase [Bacillus sp. 3255]|uniref:Gfo/Idh/MocA family protein n=1 Tax=Bacillus sp. 3255 TaxID=2817904 RepID=UPI002857DA66|nr:Gfo/Idh/MocA family oxidoreductase [Bacillus sp. 3255]MDR6884846.1 putative dehydrogenase [Bacillus sp. 3255]